MVLLGGKEVRWAFGLGAAFSTAFLRMRGLGWFCIYCMDGIGLVLILLGTTGLRKLEADGWFGKER